MRQPPDPHYRHRFPAELISHAVWLYHVFSLSFRDVELLLAERGVIVSYESVRQWCMTGRRSSAGSADRAAQDRPELDKALTVKALHPSLLDGREIRRARIDR